MKTQEQIDLAKQRHREAARRWRAANLERAREVNRRSYEKYKLETRASRREACRRSYEKHKLELREKTHSPERRLANRKYRQTVREKLNDKKRLHYLNYGELIRLRQRLFYSKDPDKYRNSKCKLLRKELGTIVKADIDWLYEDNLKRFGVLTCELCGKPIGDIRSNIDHKNPIIKGGTHARGNLHLSHWHCNYKKGMRTLEEWFRSKDSAAVVDK